MPSGQYFGNISNETNILKYKMLLVEVHNIEKNLMGAT